MLVFSLSGWVVWAPCEVEERSGCLGRAGVPAVRHLLDDHGEEVLVDHGGEEEDHGIHRLVVQHHVILHCHPKEPPPVSC